MLWYFVTLRLWDFVYFCCALCCCPLAMSPSSMCLPFSMGHHRLVKMERGRPRRDERWRGGERCLYKYVQRRSWEQNDEQLEEHQRRRQIKTRTTRTQDSAKRNDGIGLINAAVSSAGLRCYSLLFDACMATSPGQGWRWGQAKGGPRRRDEKGKRFNDRDKEE